MLIKQYAPCLAERFNVSASEILRLASSGAGYSAIPLSTLASNSFGQKKDPLGTVEQKRRQRTKDAKRKVFEPLLLFIEALPDQEQKGSLLEKSKHFLFFLLSSLMNALNAPALWRLRMSRWLWFVQSSVSESPGKP